MMNIREKCLQFDFVLSLTENAKHRSILNDIVVEAHAIREDLVDRKLSNTTHSRQHQGHPDETVSEHRTVKLFEEIFMPFQLQDDDDHQMNSRTIKEFPPDTGTLVPGRDGTMIDHTIDDGTLVPDSGTMVELESNLGTMVINSDSEDSTMKSRCPMSISIIIISGSHC